MKIMILLLVSIYSNTIAQDLKLINSDSLQNVNGFYLKNTYQNPYGATSYIEFNIPLDCNVKVFISQDKESGSDGKDYDADTLKTLYNGLLEKGFYKVTWDLTDNNNNQVENGYYNCFLIASFDGKTYKMDFQGSTRMIVMR
jgi:hypothetical protein